jgi:hypothetical protein
MRTNLKRAPFSFEGVCFAELGRAKSCDVGDEQYRFSAGNILAWEPGQKSLVIYKCKRRGRRMAEYIPGKHATTWKKWTGSVDVEYARDDSVTVPTRWEKIGVVSEIEYWSDKFLNDKTLPIGERGPSFYHPTTSNPVLYRGYGTSREKMNDVYVIKGGKLRVTARGIEG